MPMMTEAQVQSLATTLEGYESREKKFKNEKKEQHKKWTELLMAGATVGGAAMVGFVHGRYEDALSQAQLARLLAIVSLYQALGGGWEPRLERPVNAL